LYTARAAAPALKLPMSMAAVKFLYLFLHNFVLVVLRDLFENIKIDFSKTRNKTKHKSMIPVTWVVLRSASKAID
jgi:hypothetical protein